MEKPLFSVGAFGIILDEEKKILLCHRTDKDMWNLPGGVVEHGESPWEGVVREVEEETGLTVKADKLLGVYSKPDEDDVVFLFGCVVTGGSLRLNNEADKLQYFDTEALPKNLSWKQNERIHDAVLDTEHLVLKTQR